MGKRIPILAEIEGEETHIGFLDISDGGIITGRISEVVYRIHELHETINSVSANQRETNSRLCRVIDSRTSRSRR